MEDEIHGGNLRYQIGNFNYCQFTDTFIEILPEVLKRVSPFGINRFDEFDLVSPPFPLFKVGLTLI